MLNVDRLMLGLFGYRLRFLKRFLSFDREFIESHNECIALKSFELSKERISRTNRSASLLTNTEIGENSFKEVGGRGLSRNAANRRKREPQVGGEEIVGRLPLDRLPAIGDRLQSL